MPDVRIATCAEIPDLTTDDRVIVSALRDHGFTVEVSVWDDASIDWSDTRLCVVRNTWDYHKKLDSFNAWLLKTDLVCPILNGLDTMLWNSIKWYLHELKNRGVPIIDTIWIRQGQTIEVEEMLAKLSSDEIVIKPTIGATAHLAARLRRDDAAAVADHLRAVLGHADAMVQPFIPSVLETGEISIMVFDGVFSHAVRKKPKQGDYRVQDDFGGSIERYEPDAQQISLAEHIAGEVRECAYARIDLVQDDAGAWRVIEVEMIEPALYLAYGDHALRDFIETITSRLQALPT
ncbi:MAG: hypothetical protein AAF432_16305 [Planctomycetota bacterium]